MQQVPSFGTRLPGVPYRPRPGAYALVFDAAGRVAVVHEDEGWYLPGGGLEPGESSEEALAREVVEECCCGVDIIRASGTRSSTSSRRDGRYLRSAPATSAPPSIGTPTAIQLTPADACERVRRKSDAWAITAARESDEKARPHP